MRLAIDERKLWLTGITPIKDLSIEGLVARGLSEEDAAIILQEVETYPVESHIPVLVTEPGWRGEKWSYFLCSTNPAGIYARTIPGRP